MYTLIHNNETDPIKNIELLRRYYRSNDLYRKQYVTWDTDEAAFRHEWSSRIKPLRNVVPRVVDFFSLKMLPSDIQIITDNDALKGYVNQILTWSNFNTKKKLLLSDLALTGDLFLKTNIAPDKAYFTFVSPEDVIDFHEDFRGNLLDIMIQYDVEDEFENITTYTEYWDSNYWAVWQGMQLPNATLESLGDPLQFGSTAEFGINFPPFLHVKFKDLNRPDFRGTGCVEQSLDTIDEANRQATRLAMQAIRDKNIYTMSAGSVDASGFSINPVKQVKRVSILSSNPSQSEQTNDWKDDIFELPPMSQVTNLISSVDWNAIQGILDATMLELSEQLPALKYYNIKESNISVETLTLLLDASLSQAKEAGRSFTNAIVKACGIALTMGISQGLFPAFGSYDAGDFAFEINSGEPFALGVTARATLLTSLKGAGMSLETAMKLAGYQQSEIDEAVAGAEAQIQKDQAAKTAGLASTLSLISTNKG